MTDEKTKELLDLIKEYASYDGTHHKTWLLDKVDRSLAGPCYDDWVFIYQIQNDQTWDEGIAP